jgi:DNA-binding NtrC family response regulator
MKDLIITSGLNKSYIEPLVDRFKPPDFRIISITTTSKVIKASQKERPLIIILGSTGQTTNENLSQVRCLKAANRHLPIILISKNSSEARATAAFRAGVIDYFKEPVPRTRLLNRIDEILRDESRCHWKRAHPTPPSAECPPTMIGNSPVMVDTLNYLNNVAASDSTVLITGETGTGKELAAELIHHRSARSSQPMVAVNCAALPESLAESELFGYERGAFTGAVAPSRGKFALANNSTIFLDEIGDMTPYIQAKILHTIERKVVYPLGGKQAIPLNVRVIAATNQDPESLIAKNKFRKDLYYRLNIARISLPPLRKRKEDIHALVQYGLIRLNRRFRKQVKGLTPDAMASLYSYDWPGNIRELMNLLEATYINLSKDNIAFADLPIHFRRHLSNVESVPDSERRAIITALTQTNWNKSRAAQKLNWSRMTLYRKMSRLKITEMG